MSTITLQFDTAADLESALLDALQNNEGHVSGIAAYLAQTGAEAVAPEAKPTLQDYQDSVMAMFAAVGYTEEYARQWPKEKVSVTFKRWFDEQISRAAAPPAPPAPLPGKPLTKDQIAALLPLIKAEVDTLSDEGRYTFAGWLPIAVRLIEKHHGIAALSAQAAPEYRTGFDEAPSTFNAQDAAPGDYLPSVSKEQALEAFDSMLHVQKDAEAHATLRRFIEQSGRERVSADPLPRPLLTDLEIQGLRRQARNDPRCADQHWFILMVRAIESYYGVTGAAAQSQPLVEPTADKPRFQWTCANGCGNCEVKRIEFEYERTETLEGELVGSKTRPQLVSKCCGAELTMWDNEQDEEVDVSITEPAPLDWSQHQVKKGELS